MGMFDFLRRKKSGGAALPASRTTSPVRLAARPASARNYDDSSSGAIGFNQNGEMSIGIAPGLSIDTDGDMNIGAGGFTIDTGGSAEAHHHHDAPVADDHGDHHHAGPDSSYDDSSSSSGSYDDSSSSDSSSSYDSSDSGSSYDSGSSDSGSYDSGDSGVGDW
jgi:hypothetical protein